MIFSEQNSTGVFTEEIYVEGNWKSYVQGTIHHLSDIELAKIEYRQHNFDVLKQCFIESDDSGSIRFLDHSNALDLKNHSAEQYVIVYGQYDHIKNLLQRQKYWRDEIDAIVNFVRNTVDFTGVELDFRGGNDWDSSTYQNFKTFVQDLGNKLQNYGRKLIVNGPALKYDSTSDSWTSLTQWDWADFNSLPINYINVQMYDRPWTNVGKPVPLNLWNSALSAVINKIIPDDFIIVDIPSYSYRVVGGELTPTSQQDIFKDDYRFVNAIREDDSKERVWDAENGMKKYFSDFWTLSAKRKLVEDLELAHVSYTYLGGNDWFTEGISWFLQLSDIDLQQIQATNFAYGVINPFQNDQLTPWTSQEVLSLKKSQKKILAYFDLGLADDSQFYWSAVSAITDLIGQSSTETNKHHVRYWSEDWFLNSIQPLLDQALSQGFQGIVLDHIEEFSYWAEASNYGTGKETNITGDPLNDLDLSAQLMISLVQRIYQYCRVGATNRIPNFEIFIKNTDTILDYEPTQFSLSSFVHGVIEEGVWYDGFAAQTSVVTQNKLNRLKTWTDRGKKAFVIDYADDGLGHHGFNRTRLEEIRDASRSELVYFTTSNANKSLDSFPNHAALDIHEPFESKELNYSNPEFREQSVAVSSAIRLHFDEEMDTSSVEQAISIVPQVNPSFQWENSNTSLVVQPNANLAENQNYIVTISNSARNAASENINEDIYFYFNTKNNAATILNSIPADQDQGVSRYHSVQIFYSEPMFTSSVETAFSIDPEIPGSFSWDTEKTTLTFTPSNYFLEKTRYTITINSTAKDLTKQATGQNVEITFLTDDQTEPKIISCSITEGQKSVPLNAVIQVFFDEEMDTQSVENAFVLSPFADGDFTFTDQAGEFQENSVLNFTPDAALQADQLYQLSIAKVAKDKSGNALKHYNLSFTTIPLAVIESVGNIFRLEDLNQNLHLLDTYPPVYDPTNNDGIEITSSYAPAYREEGGNYYVPYTNAAISFDGSKSVGRDPKTYFWELRNTDTSEVITLSDDQSSKPYFLPPDPAGHGGEIPYQVRFRIENGEGILSDWQTKDFILETNTDVTLTASLNLLNPLVVSDIFTLNDVILQFTIENPLNYDANQQPTDTGGGDPPTEEEQEESWYLTWWNWIKENILGADPEEDSGTEGPLPEYGKLLETSFQGKIFFDEANNIYIPVQVLASKQSEPWYVQHSALQNYQAPDLDALFAKYGSTELSEQIPAEFFTFSDDLSVQIKNFFFLISPDFTELLGANIKVRLNSVWNILPPYYLLQHIDLELNLGPSANSAKISADVYLGSNPIRFSLANHFFKITTDTITELQNLSLDNSAINSLQSDLLDQLFLTQIEFEKAVTASIGEQNVSDFLEPVLQHSQFINSANWRFWSENEGTSITFDQIKDLISDGLYRELPSHFLSAPELKIKSFEIIFNQDLDQIIKTAFNFEYVGTWQIMPLFTVSDIAFEGVIDYPFERKRGYAFSGEIQGNIKIANQSFDLKFPLPIDSSGLDLSALSALPNPFPIVTEIPSGGFDFPDLSDLSPLFGTTSFNGIFPNLNSLPAANLGTFPGVGFPPLNIPNWNLKFRQDYTDIESLSFQLDIFEDWRPISDFLTFRDIQIQFDASQLLQANLVQRISGTISADIVFNIAATDFLVPVNLELSPESWNFLVDPNPGDITLGNFTGFFAEITNSLLDGAIPQDFVTGSFASNITLNRLSVDFAPNFSEVRKIEFDVSLADTWGVPELLTLEGLAVDFKVQQPFGTPNFEGSKLFLTIDLSGTDIPFQLPLDFNPSLPNLPWTIQLNTDVLSGGKISIGNWSNLINLLGSGVGANIGNLLPESSIGGGIEISDFQFGFSRDLSSLLFAGFSASFDTSSWSILGGAFSVNEIAFENIFYVKENVEFGDLSEAALPEAGTGDSTQIHIQGAILASLQVSGMPSIETRLEIPSPRFPEQNWKFSLRNPFNFTGITNITSILPSGSPDPLSLLPTGASEFINSLAGNINIEAMEIEFAQSSFDLKRFDFTVNVATAWDIFDNFFSIQDLLFRVELTIPEVGDPEISTNSNLKGTILINGITIPIEIPFPTPPYSGSFDWRMNLDIASISPLPSAGLPRLDFPNLGSLATNLLGNFNFIDFFPVDIPDVNLSVYGLSFKFSEDLVSLSEIILDFALAENVAWDIFENIIALRNIRFNNFQISIASDAIQDITGTFAAQILLGQAPNQLPIDLQITVPSQLTTDNWEIDLLGSYSIERIQDVSTAILQSIDLFAALPPELTSSQIWNQVGGNIQFSNLHLEIDQNFTSLTPQEALKEFFFKASITDSWSFDLSNNASFSFVNPGAYIEFLNPLDDANRSITSNSNAFAEFSLNGNLLPLNIDLHWPIDVSLNWDFGFDFSSLPDAKFRFPNLSVLLSSLLGSFNLLDILPVNALDVELDLTSLDLTLDPNFQSLLNFQTDFQVAVNTDFPVFPNPIDPNLSPLISLRNLVFTDINVTLGANHSLENYSGTLSGDIILISGSTEYAIPLQFDIPGNSQDWSLQLSSPQSIGEFTNFVQVLSADLNLEAILPKSFYDLSSSLFSNTIMNDLIFKIGALEGPTPEQLTYFETTLNLNNSWEWFGGSVSVANPEIHLEISYPLNSSGSHPRSINSGSYIKSQITLNSIDVNLDLSLPASFDIDFDWNLVFDIPSLPDAKITLPSFDQFLIDVFGGFGFNANFDFLNILPGFSFNTDFELLNLDITFTSDFLNILDFKTKLAIPTGFSWDLFPHPTLGGESIVRLENILVHDLSVTLPLVIADPNNPINQELEYTADIDAELVVDGGSETLRIPLNLSIPSLSESNNCWILSLSQTYLTANPDGFPITQLIDFTEYLLGGFQISTLLPSAFWDFAQGLDLNLKDIQFEFTTFVEPHPEYGAAYLKSVKFTLDIKHKWPIFGGDIELLNSTLHLEIDHPLNGSLREISDTSYLSAEVSINASQIPFFVRFPWPFEPESIWNLTLGTPGLTGFNLQFDDFNALNGSFLKSFLSDISFTSFLPDSNIPGALDFDQLSLSFKQGFVDIEGFELDFDLAYPGADPGWPLFSAVMGTAVSLRNVRFVGIRGKVSYSPANLDSLEGCIFGDIVFGQTNPLSLPLKVTIPDLNDANIPWKVELVIEEGDEFNVGELSEFADDFNQLFISGSSGSAIDIGAFIPDMLESEAENYLSDMSIQALEMRFSQSSFYFEFISFNIKLLSHWEIIQDVLSLSNLELKLAIENPLEDDDSAGPEPVRVINAQSFKGQVNIGGVLVYVEIPIPILPTDRWEIFLSLNTEIEFPTVLVDIFKPEFADLLNGLPSLPSFPDLSVWFALDGFDWSNFFGGFFPSLGDFFNVTNPSFDIKVARLAMDFGVDFDALEDIQIALILQTPATIKILQSHFYIRNVLFDLGLDLNVASNSLRMFGAVHGDLIVNLDGNHLTNQDIEISPSSLVIPVTFSIQESSDIWALKLRLDAYENGELNLGELSNLTKFISQLIPSEAFNSLSSNITAMLDSLPALLADIELVLKQFEVRWNSSNNAVQDVVFEIEARFPNGFFPQILSSQDQFFNIPTANFDLSIDYSLDPQNPVFSIDGGANLILGDLAKTPDYSNTVSLDFIANVNDFSTWSLEVSNLNLKDIFVMIKAVDPGLLALALDNTLSLDELSYPIPTTTIHFGGFGINAVEFAATIEISLSDLPFSFGNIDLGVKLSEFRVNLRNPSTGVDVSGLAAMLEIDFTNLEAGLSSFILPPIAELVPDTLKAQISLDPTELRASLLSWPIDAGSPVPEIITDQNTGLKTALATIGFQIGESGSEEDNGELSLTLPTLIYDGVNFKVEGEVNRENVRLSVSYFTGLLDKFASPLFNPIAQLIKTALEALGLSKFPFSDSDGQSNNNFMGLLPLSSANLPGDVEALLPEQAQGYASYPDLPNSFLYTVTFYNGGGFDLNLKLPEEITTGIPVILPKPLFLIDSLAPPYDYFGSKTKEISFSEVFGFFLVTYSGEFDYFYLPTLFAAAILKQASGIENFIDDPNKINAKITIVNLKVLLAPSGIPILVFFDQIRLEYQGVEGFKLESEWSFPAPSFENIGILISTFIEFIQKTLDSDPGLDPDSYPIIMDAAKMAELEGLLGSDMLALTAAPILKINAPKYLGNVSLFSLGNEQLTTSDLIPLLNFVKNPNLADLVRIVPRSKRFYASSLSFPILPSFSIGVVLTTLRETEEASFNDHGVVVSPSDFDIFSGNAINTENRENDPVVVLAKGAFDDGITRVELVHGISAQGLNLSSAFQVHGVIVSDNIFNFDLTFSTFHAIDGSNNLEVGLIGTFDFNAMGFGLNGDISLIAGTDGEAELKLSAKAGVGGATADFDGVLSSHRLGAEFAITVDLPEIKIPSLTIEVPNTPIKLKFPSTTLDIGDVEVGLRLFSRFDKPEFVLGIKVTINFLGLTKSLDFEFRTSEAFDLGQVILEEILSHVEEWIKEALENFDPLLIIKQLFEAINSLADELVKVDLGDGIINEFSNLTDLSSAIENEFTMTILPNSANIQIVSGRIWKE